MADVYAALDRALDPTRWRPELAADVEVARFPGRRCCAHGVLRQPRSACYYRLTGPEADLAIGLDGTRTVAQLAVQAQRRLGLGLQQVVEVVEMLRRRGCLTQPATDTYATLGQRLRPARTGRLDRLRTMTRALAVPVPGVPRLADALYRASGRWLFAPQIALLMAPVIVVGLVLTLLHRHDFSLLGRPTVASAATLWLLTAAAIACHELGHALAIRHAGRRILGAGVGLYFGNPVLFINSSDMVMAPPRARAINAAAGPVADFTLAGLAGLVATVIGPTSAGQLCYRFAALTFVVAAVNLFPFLELDGYWLLTDLLDLPDLRPRALTFLHHDLAARLRNGPRLSRSEWGLVAFGVLGVLATAAALVVAAIFWWPILAAFADGLWHSGWPGRSVVILLAVLIAGPLAGGGARFMATTWRAAAARWESIRFFLQRRWRITAAELVAELPQAVPLDPTELGDLAGRVQRRRFTRGQTLVRQGKTAHAFHLLRRGRCTVLEADRTGRETAVTHLRAGDSFGQWALEHDARQPVTVRADSRGELFALDAATFTRLLAGRLAPAAPLSPNWAVDQLRALAPFRDLNQGAATELARVGTWVDVRPGHTLLRQGTTGTTVYVLATGQLQTRTDERAGGILRAGDHVGQPVAVDEAWHAATVRALTPARLSAVPASTWRRLLPLMPVNCTGDGPEAGTRRPTHARDQS